MVTAQQCDLVGVTVGRALVARKYKKNKTYQAFKASNNVNVSREW